MHPNGSRGTVPKASRDGRYLKVGSRKYSALNPQLRARQQNSGVSQTSTIITESARQQRELAIRYPDIAESLTHLSGLIVGGGHDHCSMSGFDAACFEGLLQPITTSTLRPSASLPSFKSSAAGSGAKAIGDANGQQRNMVHAPQSTTLSAQATAETIPGGQTPLRASMPRITLVESDAADDSVRGVAVSAFNMRHIARSTTARGLLTAFDAPENAEWRPLSRGYDGALGEVFRNRLWLEQVYNPFDEVRHTTKTRRRRHRRWRLDDSTIWRPRKLHGNSLDYYETDSSMRTIFDSDWQFASAGIAKVIQRADIHGGSWVDSDGNGLHDSVDDAADVLWKHMRTIYGAFDYYSTLFDTGKDAHGEVDVFNMTWSSYMEFARDCELDSPASSINHEQIDMIWVAVNSLPHAFEQLRLQDKWNHPRRMCRHEFLQALVRIAVELHITRGAEKTVASAVDRLCLMIKRFLPPEALQDSNEFRKTACYNELCDRALCRQQASLRAIYAVYAKVNRNLGDELQDSTKISIGEWLSLLDDANLFQSGQLSQFGAKMIFRWSMIRARPDHSAASERKMRQLSFVDFCEALVRVACTMALPTEAELEAANAFDAGEYLHALEDAGELQDFVDANKVGWQGRPREHVSRCVNHLVCLLVRTMKQDVYNKKLSLSKDAIVAVVHEPLTESEVAQYVQRRQQGVLTFHVQSTAGLLDGVKASASIVRERLLSALHSVEIFKGLSTLQMNALCDAMAQAPFDQGTYIFEQGDVGDSFYVITEGEAEVLRAEPGSEDEKELGVLQAGAFFGERALIKNQVRYAGVRASSKKVFTVFITRQGFELALGTSLEDLMPDQYKLDEEELVQRLAALPTFQGLQPQQVEEVARCCTEVKFVRGDNIVTQGESGDAFYIITRGDANVLRWREADADNDGERPGLAWAEPEILAKLHVWDAFGERALLKIEPRYATVRAVSQELHVMSIARKVFEAALGLQPHALRRLKRHGSSLHGLAGFIKFGKSGNHV